MATLKQRLAEFRAETTVRKDGHNPFFKSKYYELEDILNALKNAQNFGIFFAQYLDGGNLVTEIEHDGETLRSVIKLPDLNEKNHQEIAKQITYFRRISLITMFGICEPDDDGNIEQSSGASSRQSAPAGASFSPVGDALTTALAKCQSVADVNSVYYSMFKLKEITPTEPEMAQFRKRKGELQNGN